MCDYSLHSVSSRPAKVGDKVFTTEFAGSYNRGLAAVGEHGATLVIHEFPPDVAVCLLPGTELAFDQDVRYDRAFRLCGKARVHHKVARFRQIDMSDRHVHHDALEFPDGRVVKVARLTAGQTATVLQLPVASRRFEADETDHVIRPSNSRIVLNRVSSRPGVASILAPNQAAVTLWQSFRSTAAGLAIALGQLLRRLKAHRGHPVVLRAAAVPTDVDAKKIEPSFTMDVSALTQRKTPAASKPEKMAEVKTAA